MRHASRIIVPAVLIAGGFLLAQFAMPRVADARATPAGDLGPAQAVLLEGKAVGWVASAARHYELGPVDTAVVKRSVPVTAQVEIECQDGMMPAIQEVVVTTG
jgi:hypothetical protein